MAVSRVTARGSAAGISSMVSLLRRDIVSQGGSVAELFRPAQDGGIEMPLDSMNAQGSDPPARPAASPAPASLALRSVSKLAARSLSRPRAPAIAAGRRGAGRRRE